jgi:DNA polymerase III delta prime subunit
MIDKSWDLKYAPTSLEDYIFPDEQTEQYFLALKKIPHLLFTGCRGTGKTTLAKLLVKAHDIDDMDFLIINASDNNSVDNIRDRVKNFVSTSSYGEYKVVLLDEADFLSQSAQSVLRGMMLDYADTASFILTGNYADKIMLELASRCDEFNFKSIEKDRILEKILEKVLTILATEKIKCKMDTVMYYIDTYYPDIRKTIKTVQQNCFDGKLVLNHKKFDILPYVEKDDWKGLRQVLTSMSDIDYNNIYTMLYKNLGNSPKFTEDEKYEEGILVIADYLRSGISANMPMLQLEACVIQLNKI